MCRTYNGDPYTLGPLLGDVMPMLSSSPAIWKNFQESLQTGDKAEIVAAANCLSGELVGVEVYNLSNYVRLTVSKVTVGISPGWFFVCLGASELPFEQRIRDVPSLRRLNWPPKKKKKKKEDELLKSA